MYKVQSDWGHCLCNLFYKKMLSQGMIFPENLLAGGVCNWKCDPCRLYLSISSWEYLEIFNALKPILSWYVMMRECEICSEVVSMYYTLTELSGAKKHINDLPVSSLQSPATCLLCAHDQTPLYTDTAGYVIAIWRLWVVIWCIWIAAHFLRAIDSKRWVFWLPHFFGTTRI